MPLSPANLAAARRLPLFDGVPPSTVARVLAAARAHEFAAGSVLFREHEPADALYVALDGYVGLKSRDGDGQESILDFVPAGQPFIIAAVLLNRPSLMSAQVIETTRVMLIPAADFRTAMQQDLALALAVNRIAAEQWRVLIGQIKSLKMRTATQRLAAFVMSLADRRAGETTVRLPCERQVLAAWLGMVPTSASRAFRDLAAIGVEGRGRTLTIKSLSRLAQFVDNPDRRQIRPAHEVRRPVPSLQPPRAAKSDEFEEFG